jgi:hypothetical protein
VKKVSGETPHRSLEQYRWCEQQEQYTSVAVCKTRERHKSRCRACLFTWRQLPLPFPDNQASSKKAVKQ